MNEIIALVLERAGDVSSVSILIIIVIYLYKHTRSSETSHQTQIKEKDDEIKRLNEKLAKLAIDQVDKYHLVLRLLESVEEKLMGGDAQVTKELTILKNELNKMEERLRREIAEIKQMLLR
jgi:peptidoglycan hydrolase CwlO-like protein